MLKNINNIISLIMKTDIKNIISVKEEDSKYNIEMMEDNELKLRTIEPDVVDNFTSELNILEAIKQSEQEVNIFINEDIAKYNKKNKKNEFYSDLMRFISMCNITNIVPTIYISYDNLTMIRSLSIDLNITYKVLLTLDELDESYLNKKFFIFNSSDLSTLIKKRINNNNLFFVLSSDFYNSYFLHNSLTSNQKNILNIIEKNNVNVIYDRRFELLTNYLNQEFKFLKLTSYHIVTSKEDLMSLMNITNVDSLTTQGLVFIYDEDNKKKINKLLELISPIAIHITIIAKSKDIAYLESQLKEYFVSSYTIIGSDNFISNISVLLLKYIFRFHRIFIDTSDLEDVKLDYICKYFDNIKIIYDSEKEITNDYTLERINSSSEDVIDEITKIIEIYGDVYDKITTDLSDFELENENYKNEFIGLIQTINEEEII